MFMFTCSAWKYYDSIIKKFKNLQRMISKTWSHEIDSDSYFIISDTTIKQGVFGVESIILTQKQIFNQKSIKKKNLK